MTAALKDALRTIDTSAAWTEGDSSFGRAILTHIDGGGEFSAKAQEAVWLMLRRYDTLIGGWSNLAKPPGAEAASDTDETAPAPAPVIAKDQIHGTLEKGRIFMRTPFEFKDLIKSIQGRKWNGDAKAWTFTATATAVTNIVEAFGTTKIHWDDACRGLLAEAAVEAESEKFRDAGDGELPEIPKFTTDAWLHQKQAYWFAQGRPAAMLAMDMGTGKTKVTIDLLVNSGAQKILVLCPANVVAVWKKELAIHGDGSIAVADGVNPKNGKMMTVVKRTEQAQEALAAPGATMVVMNYEGSIHEPFKTWSKSVAWDYLVMDEIHRIKSAKGKQSRHAFDLAKNSKQRLGLTGTPMGQSPLDVFGQFRALDSDVFGTSFFNFSHRYANYGGYGGHEILGYVRQDELNEKFYARSYRVGAEVLDLPESMDLTRSASLEPSARKLYKEIDAESIADTDSGKITAANVLVKILRLHQLTGGAVGTDDQEVVEVSTAKQKLLEEVLTDIDPSERVVVFCRFRHDLDAVKVVANNLGRTYGEVSGRRKDLVEARYPNRHVNDVHVLAVQMQSGGVGIDLTAAHTGIYFSLGHSLSDYLQSRRRILRPGQAHPVKFIHLTLTDTIDEDIYSALADRKEVVDHVLEMER